MLAEQPSDGGHSQELFVMSGALVGSGSPPPIRVGARKNSMHSMYLAGVPAFWSMLRQAIHFAPAHPDLVTSAVVTNRRANGVSSVKKVIARLRRIVPAGIAHAVMN